MWEDEKAKELDVIYTCSNLEATKELLGRYMHGTGSHGFWANTEYRYMYSLAGRMPHVTCEYVSAVQCVRMARWRWTCSRAALPSDGRAAML